MGEMYLVQLFTLISCEDISTDKLYGLKYKTKNAWIIKYLLLLYADI